MLDLIYDYEQTRYQLQKRITRLERLLRNENLLTMERENLTARRDLLMTERFELLNSINEMKKHLRKEELSDEICTAHTGTHGRS